MIDQNEPQAMNKGLLKHKVQMVHFQWTIETKGRNSAPDWDMLSTYNQDDLLRSIFVAREMLVELALENRFLH